MNRIIRLNAIETFPADMSGINFHNLHPNSESASEKVFIYEVDVASLETGATPVTSFSTQTTTETSFQTQSKMTTGGLTSFQQTSRHHSTKVFSALTAITSIAFFIAVGRERLNKSVMSEENL
jgi:hypothetical protein